MSAGTEALSTNMELTGASLWQAQMLKSIAQMEAYANVTDKAAQAQTKLEAAAHRAAVIQSQNAQKAHADATRQSQLEAKLKHDREQAAAEQEKQQKQMAQAQQGIGIGTSLLNGGGASSAIGMGLAMIPDIGPILAAGFDLGMAGVNAFGRVAGGVFDFVIGMAKEAAQVVGHVAHAGMEAGKWGLLIGLGLVEESARRGTEAADAAEAHFAQLTTVMHGNVEEAKKLHEFVNAFAAKTPFELPGIMAATIQLQAFGLEAKKWLPLIGNMARDGDIEGAALAVSMATQGQTRNLRHYGIGANELKKNGAHAAGGPVGITVATDADREAMEQALSKILENKFGGGMERLMATLKGRWTNVKDSIRRGWVSLGNALMDVEKDALGSFQTALDEMVQSGAMQRFGEKIAAGMRWILDTAREIQESGVLTRVWASLSSLEQTAEAAFNALIGGSANGAITAGAESIATGFEWAARSVLLLPAAIAYGRDWLLYLVADAHNKLPQYAMAFEIGAKKAGDSLFGVLEIADIVTTGLIVEMSMLMNNLTWPWVAMAGAVRLAIDALDEAAKLADKLPDKFKPDWLKSAIGGIHAIRAGADTADNAANKAFFFPLTHTAGLPGRLAGYESAHRSVNSMADAAGNWGAEHSPLSGIWSQWGAQRPGSWASYAGANWAGFGSEKLKPEDDPSGAGGSEAANKAAAAASDQKAALEYQKELLDLAKDRNKMMAASFHKETLGGNLSAFAAGALARAGAHFVGGSGGRAVTLNVDARGVNADEVARKITVALQGA